MVGTDWVSLLHYMGTAVASGVVDSFDPEIKIKIKIAEMTKTDCEIFKENRLKNNYSCADVGGEIGLSEGTIRRFESGKKISDDTLKKIISWQPVDLNLQKFVKKYSLKQKDVADIVGVAVTTVWCWNVGRYNMPAYAKIALKNWEKDVIMNKRSLKNE